MSGSKVLLTYKRKWHSRDGLLQENGGHNTFSVTPVDTSVHSPDMKVHLTDKNASRVYKRNSVASHLCAVCSIGAFGGNLKHCDKCLQSFHLQCLDKSQKDSGHGTAPSCRCFTAALGDDGYVGSQLSSEKGNVTETTTDSVGYEPPSSSYARTNSSDCEDNSLRLNTSNLEDTDLFSKVKLENTSDDMDDDGYVGRQLSSGKGNVTEMTTDSVGYEPPPPSYARTISSDCEDHSLRLNTSNVEDTDMFSKVKLENTSDDMGDDGYVGKQLSSEMGNVTEMTTDCVRYEPPPSSYARRNSSDCDDNSLRLNTSNLGDTDSLSKVKLENTSDDKLENTRDDMAVETKWKPPLLTFCRRSKRPKVMDEFDIQRKSLKDNCSVITKVNNNACANAALYEAASQESVSLDHGVDFNPSREAGVEALQHIGEILDQSGETLMTVKEESMDHLGNSYSSGMKENSSEAVPVCKQEGNSHALVREEPQFVSSDDNKAAGNPHSCRSLPNLNLSVITSESCSTVDLNVDLNLSFEEQPILTAPKTTPDSLNSICSNPATIFVKEERIESHASQLHKDVSESSEVGASCNDYDIVTPHFSTNFKSKNKCLQLFSEEKTSDIFNPVITQPGGGVTASMASEERTVLQLGSNNYQLKKRNMLDLDLSLPTRSTTAGCGTNRCFTTFPLNSFNGKREYRQDAALQFPSSHLSSPFRHKLMHDSITSGARAMNEMDRFSHIFKPYTTTWSEEELDFLWIGVRRYGKDNWNAMLMDPRLHFSPWRTTRDLATQWALEQSKLMTGIFGPQFKRGRVQSNSMCSTNFLGPQTGNWQHTTDETRLSLRAVNACRGGNVLRRPLSKPAYVCNDGYERLHRPLSYQKRASRRMCKYDEEGSIISSRSRSMLSGKLLPTQVPTACNIGGKGSFPQWLHEVTVAASPPCPKEPTLPSTASLFAHSDTLNVPDPTHGIHHMDARLAAKNKIQSADGGLKLHKDSSHHEAKKSDLIVIDGDVSSEGTLSDQ